MFRGLPERAKLELLAYSETAYARASEEADRLLVSGLLDVLRDVEAAPLDELMTLAFYEDSRPPDPDRAAFLPLTW